MTRLKKSGRTGGDAPLSGFSQASVTSVTFFADMCQCSLAKMIYDMICVKVYTVYTDCVCFVLIPNWPVDLTIVSRSDTAEPGLMSMCLTCVSTAALVFIHKASRNLISLQSLF